MERRKSGLCARHTGAGRAEHKDRGEKRSACAIALTLRLTAEYGQFGVAMSCGELE